MLKLVTTIFLFSTLSIFSNSKFSAERIENACIDFLKSKINNEFNVNFINQVTDLEFTEDDVEAYFELAGAEIGISSIKIIFLKGNADIRRVTIPVKIYQVQNVAIARQELKIGDLISTSKFKLEKRAIDYRYDIDLNSIDGTLSKRVIKIGDILSSDYIEYPSIIKKGEDIFINVQTASVVVKAKGKALNNAKVGEEVSIQRDGSKKIIKGVATSDGSVIVKR